MTPRTLLTHGLVGLGSIGAAVAITAAVHTRAPAPASAPAPVAAVAPVQPPPDPAELHLTSHARLTDAGHLADDEGLLPDFCKQVHCSRAHSR